MAVTDLSNQQFDRFGVNTRLIKKPKNVIRLFQQLQVLNILFNDSFASLATPTWMTQLTILHVLTIFVAMRLHGNFPMVFYGLFAVWSVLWFVIEGLMYTMLGNVNYYSRGVVQSWTDTVGTKSRKKLRSMRPMGIKAGTIYVVHRTTVMHVFLAIANFTVQTLLVH